MGYFQSIMGYFGVKWPILLAYLALEAPLSFLLGSRIWHKRSKLRLRAWILACWAESLEFRVVVQLRLWELTPNSSDSREAGSQEGQVCVCNCLTRGRVSWQRVGNAG